MHTYAAKASGMPSQPSSDHPDEVALRVSKSPKHHIARLVLCRQRFARLEFLNGRTGDLANPTSDTRPGGRDDG